MSDFALASAAVAGVDPVLAVVAGILATVLSIVAFIVACLAERHDAYPVVGRVLHGIALALFLAAIWLWWPAPAAVFLVALGFFLAIVVT
jgi:hypothetical protein